MLLFLHLAGLVYGVLGLAWFRLMATPGQTVTAAFAKQATALFPASVYSPIIRESDEAGEEVLDFSKTNWLLGAITLYCGRYVLTARRG